MVGCALGSVFISPTPPTPVAEQFFVTELADGEQLVAGAEDGVNIVVDKNLVAVEGSDFLTNEVSLPLVCALRIKTSSFSLGPYM